MNLPSLFRHNGYQPLRSLARMQKDFDRLFRELTEADADFVNNDFAFSPSCELTEEKNGYVMKFDIPGVKKEDVKVELDGNQLTVSAERHEEKKSEDKKSRFSEINYGAYQRSFSLPTAVDAKKVDAKFENGVLTLKLPKSDQSNAKQIAVQ